jgi:hypothetical protein
MSRTPDSNVGPLQEGEAIILGDAGGDPSTSDDYGFPRTYKVWRNGELIKQAPNASDIWILLDEKQHRILQPLVHDVVETCYYEVTYAGSKVMAEIWWTNVSKLTKIREIAYTYTGSKVSTETWYQYKAGVKVATSIFAYTYSGNAIISATQTYSEP